MSDSHYEDLTPTPLLGGRVTILQPGKGYRFSVDPLLLAGFCRLSPDDRVLDLGTGSGVVSVLLARAFPQISLVGLEIQPRLAEIAHRNAEQNGLAERFRVVRGDLRDKGRFPPSSFEAVAVNPPYRPLGAGRLGPDQERNTARHELTCTLADWVSAAAEWLAPKGRLFAVYPAWRAVSLLAGLKERGLFPKRLRTVHQRPGAEASLILVEARQGGREELVISPPFFIQAGSVENAPNGRDLSAEMVSLNSGELLGGL